MSWKLLADMSRDIGYHNVIPAEHIGITKAENLRRILPIWEVVKGQGHMGPGLENGQDRNATILQLI